MLSLRTYQRDACDATWRYLCQEKGSAPVVVLPTGAGKSLVIAELCRQALEWQGRVIVLAHRKELLEQNAAEIQELLPQHRIGVYSAGLKSRDVQDAIVCAGIQSCYAKAHLFGMRNLVIIDEAHLCPADGEGTYRQFLMELSSLCLGVRRVGLTATPYRLDSGQLCSPQNLFQKVCYSAPLRQLMDDGYLSLLTNKTAKTKFNLDNIAVHGGEFNATQMQAAFNGDDAEVAAACQEVIDLTRDRKSVLVFASGVSHAERVAQLIEQISGERCGLIVGETDSLDRSSTLRDFKDGSLRFCVNCNVLTVGFNNPRIDAIAVLRATLSPGLFAQMCGRGLRKFPAKDSCLILDFGSNIERHGPLDDPKYGCKVKAKGNTGEAPSKFCPGCEQPVPIGSTVCMNCGFEFPREQNRHGAQADGQSAILVEPTTYAVTGAIASLHVKRNADPGAPPTLRIDYDCHLPEAEGNLSGKTVSEWVCVEHDGFARSKAVRWWRDCSSTPCPATVAEAVTLHHLGACGVPSEITTVPDGPFTRISARKVSRAAPIGDAAEPEIDEWAQTPMPVNEINEADIPF